MFFSKARMLVKLFVELCGFLIDSEISLFCKFFNLLCTVRLFGSILLFINEPVVVM